METIKAQLLVGIISHIALYVYQYLMKQQTFRDLVSEVAQIRVYAILRHINLPGLTMFATAILIAVLAPAMYFAVKLVATGNYRKLQGGSFD